jgi:hypothetical protein
VAVAALARRSAPEQMAPSEEELVVLLQAPLAQTRRSRMAAVAGVPAMCTVQSLPDCRLRLRRAARAALAALVARVVPTAPGTGVAVVQVASVRWSQALLQVRRA